MNVKIYTKVGCPFCKGAKELLTERGYEFDEVVVSGRSFSALKKRTGQLTVPQIFFGERLIGGFDDLQGYLG